MASLVGATAPYGMKAIRQMKAGNTTGLPPQPTARQAKRKQDAIIYFHEKVDPILGDCITHLLLDQPADVIKGMIEFLVGWDTTKTENVKTEKLPSLKPRKELKLYLATAIGPVVGKLANRVAAKQPEDVKAFLIKELESMTMEDALLPHVTTTAPGAAAGPSSAKEPATATAPTSTKIVEAPVQRQTMQIAVFGINNAGKSTIVNMLQGKLDPKMKPTVGFRPIPMSIGEDMLVKFYDLGGGKRIRDIWSQYYHDVHAIIYVVDSTVADSAESVKETIDVFQQTLDSPFLKGKPLLILANKQDLPNAKSPSTWQTLLPIPFEYHGQLFVRGCSAFIPEDVNSETYQADPNIEAAIDTICQAVLSNYNVLNERVKRDSAVKAQEEARKRIEKERRVLRNKIATAFIEHMPAEYIAENHIEPDKNNIFDVHEGVGFLVGEIGEELNEIGHKVAAMVGYQRLALQIVGALKAPISKKKTPMTWDEIYTLVSELRDELGLPKL
jgi:Arf/Sar family protein